MKDPRLTQLAHNLIHYSCELKPGERVLIENTGLQREFVAALVREAYAVGGQPFVQINDPVIQRELMMGAGEAQLETLAGFDGMRMEAMQAYIGIRSGDNSYETSDVPPEQVQRWARLYNKPVHSQIRVPKTKWVEIGRAHV